MTIYIVDDEIAALGLLEDAIKEVMPNAELETFDRPRKILERVKEKAPDIAFLDIEMPEMNGIDLAREILAIKPNINVIFATGYSEYALDALSIYASGYILKPADAKDVKVQLEHLRHPVSEEPEIFAKTFGDFSFFVNGKPVKFRLAKSQELLAYLIDREGSVETRQQLAAVLYEESNFSRNEQKDLSRIVSWLAQDLEAVGVGYVFENNQGKCRIIPEKIKCDLYDYLHKKGNVTFSGEYMEQYSWGEVKKWSL